MSGIVAIVGRPNVGKSTLFNRLIQRKEAIVDEVSGVTRDRHYGKSDWNGIEFSVIDTGGYLPISDDVFQKEIDKFLPKKLKSGQILGQTFVKFFRFVSFFWGGFFLKI